MPRIFISYRREDSAGHAGRLIDRLRRDFGSDSVFIDVDNIHLGHDFKQELEKAVALCNVMIVVIGKMWLDCQDPITGTRRIDSKEDWVRFETVEALNRRIPVVPVLVQGAKIPKKKKLPEDLQALSDRQAATLSDEHWEASTSELVRRLTQLSGKSGPKYWLAWPYRSASIVAVVTMVGVFAAAWTIWWSNSSEEQAPGTSEPQVTVPPASQSGLFETHKAIGGVWYEAAFSAYITFSPDGSVSGTYYQHPFNGNWTPRSTDSLIFTVSLTNTAENTTLQWESGMFAKVDGDTMELIWPVRKIKDYAVRKKEPSKVDNALPPISVDTFDAKRGSIQKVKGSSGLFMCKVRPLKKDEKIDHNFGKYEYKEEVSDNFELSVSMEASVDATTLELLGFGVHFAIILSEKTVFFYDNENNMQTS